MGRRFAVLAIMFCLAPAVVFATGEVSEDGTVGMSFLRIDPAAATNAMGGQGTALNAGASSIWANPALAAGRRNRAVQFTHIAWIAGINHEFAAVTLPAGRGNLGFTLQFFDSGNIDLYGDAPSDTPLGTYSTTNAALSVLYARNITDRIAFGAAYKQLFEKIIDETAHGYAVDVGLNADLPVPGLTAAVAARNYGRMSKFKSDRSKLPSDVALGLAYRTMFAGRPMQVAGDWLIPKYGNEELRLGAEISPVDNFFVRAGYRSDSDIQDISFGAGVVVNMFAFDIAYTPMRGGFEDALRFTLGVTGF